MDTEHRRRAARRVALGATVLVAIGAAAAVAAVAGLVGLARAIEETMESFDWDGDDA